MKDIPCTAVPWQVVRQESQGMGLSRLYVRSAGITLCEVMVHPYGNGWRDAETIGRVMATAPELLDALEDMVRVHGRNVPESLDDDSVLGRARRAIAKARGTAGAEC